MSSSYTSLKVSFNNAYQFKESFFEPEPATTGYIFIANHIPFANESSPDIIQDTVYDEKVLWENMYAAKKITGNDVEFVIPKIEWTSNSRFRQFDDTIELSELITSNSSQNLLPIYVMNSERNVYKCLCNNVSTNSLVEPNGKGPTSNGVVNMGDGYLWKYMYNVKPSNKFFSNTWIPAPTSVNQLDYDTSQINVVDGELAKVVMTNSGNNYIHSNVIVSSFTSGCTTLTVINTGTSNVFNISANMAISGTGIPGSSYISTIDYVNNLITINNPTSSNGGGTAVANVMNVVTRIYFEGDGSGTVAEARLSGNTIDKIIVTTTGRNYTRANVRIFGTGSGAEARVVLPPKFGHGYNSAKELGGKNVMVTTRIGEIDSTEGGIISSNTSFRQYGLLINPYKYGTTTPVSVTNANTVISQTTNVTLVSGTPFNNDEFVYQGSAANNTTFSGYVNVQSTNEVRLTRVKGSITIGNVLKGQNTNPTGRTVVNLISPEFEPFAGDILYAESIEKVERTDGQAENIKFVVKF